MTYRFKVLVFACFGFVFSLWWFGVNNQVTTVNIAELAYTPQEYAQDMSKIYFDLGQGSERRGDFVAAVAAYQEALKHNPEAVEVQQHLKACQNRMRQV